MSDLIKEQIVTLLTSFEPRVSNVQVQTENHETSNYFQINIFFNIANITGKSFSVPIVLPVR